MEGAKMKTTTFIVPGQARPKVRPQVTRGGRHTFTPDKWGYPGTVAGYARKAGLHPTDGAVEVHIIIMRALPKSTSKAEAFYGQPVTVKPDGVNIEANIWDALTGIAYKDDAQVASWSGQMCWAKEHLVEITVIQELSEPFG